ncbi:T9SS type A sorting domain-containing protein [Gaetbulibacter sp. M240]|uniref:T9SS type A sorting domain-containing protein n=1 Tax=Gaetbulibacter sp. M240 TaxID=3126511 RepID=UPI00374FC53D
MRTTLCLILGVFLPIQFFAAEITWNLNATYGVTQSGFANIISDARTHFLSHPDDTIIVTIDEGTYNIGGNGSHGINFRPGFQPGPNGRLIFKGAGMDLTKLIFTETRQDMMNGIDVYRITFQDMHMARPGYTVTQGTVVSIAAGELVLEIQNGFPTPLELYDDTFAQGRYFRKYTNSTSDPQVIQEDNDQVPWGYRNGVYLYPELVSGNTWKFYLSNPNQILTNYAVGDLVGVKSKHEGEIYWFNRGGEVVFENIKWTGSSRGLVRGGFSDLTIRGCRIERGEPINGQMPCLSTPSGGPQMNQPSDIVSTNMIVENCFIDSPGDDCVAFFNVNCGKVLNSTLRNSFARGFLVTPEASNICGANNIMENNPYQIDNGQPLTEITDCGSETLNITAADSYLSNAGTLYTESAFFADIYDDPGCDIVKYINLSIETLDLENSNENKEKRISYPNGTTGIIRFSKLLKTVSVFNTQGKEVLKINEAKGIRTLNISHLSSGTYFLKLDGSVIEKVIKK